MDEYLFKKIKYDDYMYSAVIEYYETLRDILYGLLDDEGDKLIVRKICDEIDASIEQKRFLNDFRMSELPQLNSKLEKLLNLLKSDTDIENYKRQIINVLQDIMEIITQDVMTNGHSILERSHQQRQDIPNDKKGEKFQKLNLNLTQDRSWMEKVVSLHLLLTVKESAINVPMNLEARRRITFFANSLFMNMLSAPKVRNMLSFSVLTPYYKEDVLYSEDELNKENEDGISILFYLQNVYPDEWNNFLERTKDPDEKKVTDEKKVADDAKINEWLKEHMDLVRQWVSYRGQTLFRTVRGMMYYRQALELQCFLDMAEDREIFDINHLEETPFAARSQAVASWLFAPSVFNPSGFEWQKTVDDWTDWKRWMGNRGGIGIQPDRSWESWWDSEQEHLKHTDIRGRVLEIILALRFLVYQYGIVYPLNIARNSKSILVYGLSWLVMATVLLVLKMVSMGRRRSGTDFQLMFRILKGLLFLGFISVMSVLFVVCALTISDVFASMLCFLPTGWAFVLIGQACKPLLKYIGFWDSIKELARAYEYVMGILFFMPIVILSWFLFVTEFQTRLLFNQAFSRGLQISMILAGHSG